MRHSPRQIRALFVAAQQIRASDRLFEIETATFPHMDESARQDIIDRLRDEARGADASPILTDPKEIRSAVQKINRRWD